MSKLAHVHNYTTPDWAPLEAAVKAAGLPLATCGEFMWMCENPAGVHQYKHRDTRKYVHVAAAGPVDPAAVVGARLLTKADKPVRRETFTSNRGRHARRNHGAAWLTSTDPTAWQKREKRGGR